MDFEKAVASIFDLCRTTEEINRAFDELQASIGQKKDAKMEETRQLVLENLNPTTQEKLQVLKKRVEDYLDRRKQIFWDLTVIILKNKHPEFFINEQTKVFGQFKDQVFNLPTTIKFSGSFNFNLDFTKREANSCLTPEESKRLWHTATPYNPDSDYGKRILNEALSVQVNPVHLILNPSKKLQKGQRGRLVLSAFKMYAPENKIHLISTIIDDQGAFVPIDAEDIFDHIKGIKDDTSIGYIDFIKQLHEQDVAQYIKSEKTRIDILLKVEVDKLNRWLVDEKQAINLKSEKMKNKITSLKRQFKMEKNFAKKLALDEEIRALQKETEDNEFNTFDIERELEKKCNRLIGGKKRSLKINYEIEPVFDVTWSVG